MKTIAPQKDYSNYCGTHYAAKLLGVSVGTVQNLVERDLLSAWRTQGGHRRISFQSIYDYLSERKLSLPVSWGYPESQLRVFVVEEDDDTRVMYRTYFDDWGLDSLDVIMYASCLEALLDMSLVRPHVLLTDLKMPHMSGFEFIDVIKKHKLFSDLVVIAVSSLDLGQIEFKGRLPQDVQLLVTPIDMKWLRGFFESLITMYGIGD